MSETFTIVHDSIRDDAIYTPSEIGHIVKVSAERVTKAIKNGRIPARRFGRSMLRVQGIDARRWAEAGVPCDRHVNAAVIRSLISKHGDNDGLIYFVRSAQFVKVGFTTELSNRLMALNCHNPMPIEVLGVVGGSISAEKAIHALLRDRKQKLEWFRLDAELTAVILELCAISQPQEAA